jgi:EAL domain-containing protein (putative c-di-GMP-specific phosphodiesterase class I)
MPALCVAVNVSAAQFRQATLPGIITEALRRNQLDASSLELEVTESIVMSNPEEAAATLEQLRQMGVRISIDDFGTGYSSLSYLKKFPIDTLKVDRSFIKDVTWNQDDGAIVRAIVALAHTLKLKIIAEGVEDAEQVAFLEALGCDQYQGYFFSRPVPAHEIPKMIVAQTVHNRTALLEPVS